MNQGGDDEGEDLYDEFGNYIGPQLDSSSGSSSSEDEDEDDSGSSSEEEGKNKNTNEDEPSDMSDDDDEEGDTTTKSLVPHDPETVETAEASSAIVLHEDKVHYPSAAKVYGANVRTVVLDEDAMELETPLVEPVKTKRVSLVHDDFELQKQHEAQQDEYGVTAPAPAAATEEELQRELVSDAYVTTLMANETTLPRRGIAIVGHLHTGKTCLMDMLLEQQMLKNHPDALGPRASLDAHVAGRGGIGTDRIRLSSSSGGGGGGALGPPRLTDTLLSEQARQMSLKSTPLTLALPSTKGKHYLLTMIDCPGHLNFHDESVAAMRATDAILLVIDVVEGPQAMHTPMLLRHAISEGLVILLCVNKLDRLILELKLPPQDAYYKLLHCIDSVNQMIGEYSGGKYPTLSPDRGNVCFACSQHGYSFTLESFAELYADQLQRGGGLFQRYTKKHHHNDNNDSNSNDSDSDNDSDADTEEEEEDYDYYNEDTTQNQNQPIPSGLGQNLTLHQFAKRLWGDCYLDPTTRTFRRRAAECTPLPKSKSKSTPPSSSTTIQRTFVQFVLEPLYKLYGLCVGEEEKTVDKVLRQGLGVLLNKEQLKASVRPLLRTVLKRVFGRSTGLVDMIVEHVPCPAKAAKIKVKKCYTGPQNTPLAKAMQQCLSRAPHQNHNQPPPLMIHAVKLYAHTNGQSFSTFGRIYSGTIQPGQRVRVLGESYSPQEDEEDMAIATVTSVSIPQGRRRMEVTAATAGNWVLLEGLDGAIAKTATITNLASDYSSSSRKEEEEEEEEEEVHIFKPLQFPQAGHHSLMKLAVEPLHPAELPKMMEGLRRVSKSYPMAQTRVEESGEHVLFGTGELYLDCIMHDLRHTYSDGMEVKVADPVVAFRETVVETSVLQCFAETPNKRNKLTMIAEPMDDGLAEKIEAGKIDLEAWGVKKVGRYFQSQYDWDLLSARSVWAFGPSPTHGPNILLDDTLPTEVNKDLLQSCKSSIIQGFQWAHREGPLCEEPVRSTKIRILDATLADRPIHRGGGQIIPTARRTVHSSLLTATPRLLEPIYRLQIQCPGDIVDAIQPMLNKRRGHIVRDAPIPGTPLSMIKAFLPLMDSFGFETDLRTFTQGQAMVFSVFDRWSIVPGDPLDQSIVLHPLEPSPSQHLAREFLVKTRRRKGLAEDVSVTKFFDEGMKEQYAEMMAEDKMET